MDTHALLALLLAVLSRDAFGRSPEGALVRENIRKEANGVGKTSSVRHGVLTPWKPRSLSPERMKRSLGKQDRNYEYDLQEEGPAIADPSVTSHSAQVPSITRLLPVFHFSEVVRDPESMGQSLVADGVYLPPARRRVLPKGLRFAPNIVNQPFLPCTGVCEARNSNGDCEIDVMCIFV
ncbi:uncharacterized protein LOC125046603 isoform X2 [Penaeus chinensis]|nr:uncharacterized protein LOC125046603 isoform X2 [Penaeus chinensis]XP_047500372.1 uncharacterized protein LOC125046603 isoform X2 [Penaeus chinensis]